MNNNLGKSYSLPYQHACTTMCAGKNATVLGKSITSHSDDNELGDQSIVYVPAKDYEYRDYAAVPTGPNSVLYQPTVAHWGYRNVYTPAVAVGPMPVWNCFNYPRLNIPADERGLDYYYGDAFPKSIRIGKIPQIEHTFAYIDGSYGIINEYGLSFGECTNGTIFQCGPTDSEDGSGKVKRLFYSSELSRVALERCKTAKEAVILMGKLIDIYGYYGTGETLPIADGEEAYVFEMFPSKTGEGGYWCGVRIPDDEIFWAGNESRIQIIKANGVQTDYYNYTEGKYEYYIGKQIFVDFGVNELNWESTSSAGEYNHPRYSRRRCFRAMSLCAPSLELNPDAVRENSDGTFATYLDPYPFSVKPDKLLTLKDIFSIHRDHYEGTRFDLTKQGQIDPYGNPNRYNTHGYDSSGDVGTSTPQGAWERPISHYYTGYSFVNVPNPHGPKGLKAITWMGMNVPGETCYIPLNVSETGKAYTKMDTGKFDISKMWWVNNRVAEECYKRYCFIKPDIVAQQELNENESLNFVNEITAKYPSHRTDNRAVISKMFSEHQKKIQQNWTDLWYKLIVKYNQGFKFENQDAYTLGYPGDWLEHSEWKNGPINYDQTYNGNWVLAMPGMDALVGIYCQVVIFNITNPTVETLKENIRYTSDQKYVLRFLSNDFEMKYDKETDEVNLIRVDDPTNIIVLTREVV